MFEAPLKGRDKYWITQFVIMIIIMFTVYLSGFLNANYNLTNE